MKKAAAAVLFVSSFLTLSGCTTAQWYDSLQDAQRDRCNKMMEPDRSACLRNTQTDYNTYKKQQ